MATGFGIRSMSLRIPGTEVDGHRIFLFVCLTDLVQLSGTVEGTALSGKMKKLWAASTQ